MSRHNVRSRRDPVEPGRTATYAAGRRAAAPIPYNQSFKKQTSWRIATMPPVNHETADRPRTP